ncbi:MAG: carboxypeptidase regulatory-like domain-containing protein [Pyrinomonadaceae bacterium]
MKNHATRNRQGGAFRCSRALGGAALLVAASILLTAAPSGAWAQSFKATLVGEITDQNGAALPGATVTITQQGTNQTQTATTTEDGGYTIPQLTPGRYTLRAEATGFKAAVQEGLVLETSQTQRVNLTLEPGGANEQINVTAETPVVNTDTSGKGEVITARQVQDLPLNGRNFTDLALLTPGVYRRPSEDDQGEGLATAGTRTDASNFILDGINNRSDRNANVGVSTSVDSIREFKVETSTYSAEQGRTAGAQVNVVSKSGTNEFNGSLFEYFRNDIFDARNPFDPPGFPKKLRRNQFGGAVGGPLPFFNFGEGGPTFTSGRDRMFFFVSYEGTRERRSQPTFNTAPNAAWLRGDFRNVRGAGVDGIPCPAGDPGTGNSSPCRDDTNRVLQPVFNAQGVLTGRREFAVPNVIPEALFNSVSRQILPFLPAANVPGVGLDIYNATGVNRPDRDQYLFKVDRRIGESNNFYVRYARQSNNGFVVFPSARNFYPGFGRDTRSRNDSVALSDTHVFSPRVINEARFGFFNQDTQNLGENRDVDYVAQFGIPGLLPGEELQGFPAIRIDGFSEFGDRPNDPFSYKLRTYQFFDTVSVVRGNQNIKIGVDIIRSNFVENDVRNVRGDFRFRGRNTIPTNAAGTGSGNASSGFRSFADFLLGLPDSTQRQIGALPADLTGTQYAFFVQDDWRIHPRLTLNLGLRYEYQTALTEATGRLANFIPELGTVVLAGDSSFPENLVEADKNNFGPRVGFALRPFGDDKTVIRGGAGIYYSLETFNPIRQQLAVQAPFLIRETYNRNVAQRILSFQNPFPQGTGAGGTNPRGLGVDYEQPEVYQYNLTLEREIARDLAFEIGYVGSQGRHLGLRYNLNAPVPTGALNSTGAPVTLRRFPQFSDIQFQDQFGNSSYNALQTSLRRRNTNGLTLLLSYTFSRSIDTGSSTNNSTLGSQEFPQDVRDILRTQRGLSDFHRKHQFSGSFNYELPFGRGRRFFGDATGLAQTLLGGIQLNGNISLLSGRPFTPQFSAADVAQQRPDIVGDPYANIPAGLRFNPAAFRRPAASAADPNLFGNAGRNILIGPSFETVDLSLLKNFQLREDVRLQFRVEMFNALNHPNYQVPIFQLDNSNVGRVVATASEAREFQFALKLLF